MSEKENKQNEYRVVVGIDFGTTYSGFAYAHKKAPREIFPYIDWPEFSGRFKTPTALLYDEGFKNLKAWGFPALAERPTRRNKNTTSKPVERFKLHLGKMENKPPLPNGLDYKKAITDYLRELSKLIKQTIDNHWKLDFFEQVLLVVTVPSEFDDNAISIMRTCSFEAGLMKSQNSRNLVFTTEPEAAAVHCMKSLNQHNIRVGANFMVVDCGGGTVDLTTRQLLDNDKLSEITERTGDYCGGSYVDQEFLKFLGCRVGVSTVNTVIDKHYHQLQYMVQEFCRQVKIKFTGIKSEFVPVNLELDELCPVLEKYCKGEYLNRMEQDDWSIRLNFEDVKAMFDPVIERIIRLINNQLRSNNNCSALIMVGGFSESKYLQSRIKQEFSTKVKIISIPPQPVTAIVKGAVEYGLREEVVSTRVLKWTYGTDITGVWRRGDPEERKLPGGKIVTFDRLAKRGTQVAVDQKVVRSYIPCSNLQRKMGLDVYITPEDDAKYCEHPVKPLGRWSIDLPLSLNDDDRSIIFTLTFGNVEIQANVVNSGTGESYDTKFLLDI
ncbi:6280_t:CDS:2 [Funneliformis geosporum]|uniref:11027_t:CDS:1 n=1 Tax=Funneliformis geosporum TaxID=1117311 RepID=A0A9W4SLV0_9GLOM|nr:11027_t:CDS:2 [Funneliformis geosporum]CAI2174829.1 6280_t:CDS:2 [Funneliformis geosporum]